MFNYNLKFLILGANGMAGATIFQYLKEEGYKVVGVDLYGKEDVLECDVTNFENLDNIVVAGNFDVIINCVGILNKMAEENKELALILNTVLPHHLAKVTEGLKTRVFQMSTDCVFSGNKGQYTEESAPDGKTWYDKTKAMGELNDNKNLTFRNSIVGPDVNENGIGLFNWFMKQSGQIDGYTRAIWTGVTTLQLAKVMEFAANTKITGLFNCVNNESIDKYNLLKLFNKYMKRNLIINPNGVVYCDKSLKRTNFNLNYNIPSYESMVKEMSEWIYKHKSMYPHYF